MNDIRLSVGFVDHPKTKKLARKLGFEAVVCVLRLWSWTAQNRCKGVFDRMDVDDIEIASGWSGDEGLFVSTCVNLRLIDDNDGIFSVHDWEKNQPWAFHSDARSDKAKKAAEARWAKKKECSEHATSIAASIGEDAFSNAPLPSPSPSPIPNPIPKKKEKKKNTYVEDSDEFRLAQYLFNCIRKNNPNFKEPDLQKWSKHIDLMIRNDKRSVEKIKAVIKWVQEDNIPDNGFCWSVNILSTSKLRKKFDTLTMKMESEKKNGVKSGKEKRISEKDFSNLGKYAERVAGSLKG